MAHTSFDTPQDASARRPKAVAALAGLVVACALPFVVEGYQIYQLTFVMIYAIALLGLNLLTGYNGQISIGHGAFFAVGAYASAILIDQFGFPYYVTIPLAGLICFACGFLFGLPALRLEGHYLALATFSLAVAVPQLLKSKALSRWTGGAQGIVLTKPEAPFGLPLTADQWLYFMTFAITIAMFVLAVNLLRGRIGRALIAIRDEPIAATAMGVNTTFYKTTTFGISALYTGIAGCLSAVAVQFVAPDSFTVFLSISLLVGIVVGGLSSISGAIFGAFFIQFVPNLADQISKSAPWAIYGVFLILFVFFMPTGIGGAARKVAAWMEQRRSARKQVVHSIRVDERAATPLQVGAGEFNRWYQ
jgi:branched-chain amino acid transport system permease protein